MKLKVREWKCIKSLLQGTKTVLWTNRGKEVRCRVLLASQLKTALTNIHEILCWREGHKVEI